ncbi:MAG: GNAT family N-acetyltransferase [Paracoccaceae bacterium]
MTPDANWLAQTHASSFTDTRSWTAAEFSDLLRAKGTYLAAKSKGFVLARAVLDEAEILTIAVLPDARRLGFGGALLAELEANLLQDKVSKIHLEVSAENTAALALYYRSGYLETGRRSGYYASAGTIAQDALILSKNLI